MGNEFLEEWNDTLSRDNDMNVSYLNHAENSSSTIPILMLTDKSCLDTLSSATVGRGSELGPIEGVSACPQVRLDTWPCTPLAHLVQRPTASDCYHGARPCRAYPTI